MPIRCEGKKFILSLILIIFLIGGFFVYANNAQADPEPPPSGAAPNTTITVPGASKSASEPAEWSMRIPVLFHAIGGIFFLILKLLNGLVWLGANLADSILKITSFTTVNVVTIGWGITRGLANMFFALILLVMSISTILQIESFGIKKILPRLITAALLINFSLMFAGIIIDFAQIMTAYFLTAGAGGTGISANLTNGLKIVQVYNFSDVEESIFKKLTEVMSGPSLQMIVEQFMAIILFIVAAFAFFAMSFFLIARIVWIWLLLIFAPLAWISFIVPNAPGQLGSLWNDWWKKFLSWTLFAPIYAFFLYLALTIAKNGVSLNTGPWGGNGPVQPKALQSGFFASPETILQYIVIIMILLGGLKAAQTMGVTGANKISDWGKKGYRAAGRVTERWAARGAPMPKIVAPVLQKMGFEGAARGWEKGMRVLGAPKRVLAPLASPTIWKKYLAATRSRAEQRAFSEPSGAMQDVLSKKGIKSLLKGKVPTEFYQTMERDKVVGARIGEITKAMPDENQRTNAYLSATDPLEKEALMRSLGSTNSINTLFQEMFTREMNARPELKAKAQELDGQEQDIDQHYFGLENLKNQGLLTQKNYDIEKEKLDAEKAEIQKEKEKTGITAIEEKYKLDPEKFQGLMAKEFGNQADRIGNDVQMMMTANGNFSATGTYKWDPEKNRIKATTEDERKGMAQNKFNEWEPQKFWTSAHPDSFFQSTPTINHQGKIEMKVTGLTGNGKVYLENMTGLHYGQMNRAQARMLSKIVSEETQQVMERTLDEKLKPKYNELIKVAEKVMAERREK